MVISNRIGESMQPWDTAFEVVVEHLDKAENPWWHAVCLKDRPHTFTMNAVERLLKIDKVYEQRCVPF